MTDSLYEPSADAEARLLLLIDRFSARGKVLEGRTKLAKLDFFLRYPHHLRRAHEIRTNGAAFPLTPPVAMPSIQDRMVRFRFGPWDPAYYSLLGRLIARGLVDPMPYARGIGFKTSDSGAQLAARLRNEPEWAYLAAAVELLHQHFDNQGAWLKRFVYENFPEVTGSRWGQAL